jgi:DNA ligase (NAD+)
LKNLLDQASSAYYAGEPIMSDASFDILASHFNYNMVGHQVTGGLPHFFPMYSLLKVFDMDEAPLDINDCIETPKLDGAAISVLYVNGRYTLALTRGDGEIGQDITQNVSHLVPLTIRHGGVVQITGEVLAPKDIPNSRNYASGALNLKDEAKFLTRDLRFVAYGVEETVIDSWKFSMEFLHFEGFNTVLEFDVTDFPTDGKVYRIDNYAAWKALGFTSKHPRGSFAFKIQKDAIPTTLLDVIWQVGKSGVVSPVAILEPIVIGDANVARATLHNFKYIQDLGLEIGCTVGVIRSGEIIPRVVERLD